MSAKEDGLMIILSSPSGAGKTTLSKLLSKQNNYYISVSHTTRKPRINWQFPINPQRDIKRFQIFKRFSTSDPFTLIAEYDFDNSTIRTSVSEVALEDRLFRFPFPKISFALSETS